MVIKSFEQAFQSHYTAFEIGKITAIPFGFAAVSMLLRALYNWKVRHRSLAYRAAPVVCAVSIGVVLALPSPVPIMAAFAIASAACFNSMAPFWRLPSRLLSSRAAAAGIGLIAALGGINWFRASLSDRLGQRP